MSTLFWRKLRAACLIGFIAMGSARAQTITFDSVPSAGNPEITTLTTQGFLFTSGHFHVIGDSFATLVGNGTVFIAEEAGALGLPITMARVSGAPFSLLSFEGAEDFVAPQINYPIADFIDVLGTRAGGETVSASFALDGLRDGVGGIPDFQNFALPDTFLNVSSVVFSGRRANGGAGAIALDNIRVGSAVNVGIIPEPSSALIGVALLAFCASARRRRVGRDLRASQ